MQLGAWDTEQAMIPTVHHSVNTNIAKYSPISGRKDAVSDLARALGRLFGAPQRSATNPYVVYCPAHMSIFAAIFSGTARYSRGSIA